MKKKKKMIPFAGILVFLLIFASFPIICSGDIGAISSYGFDGLIDKVNIWCRGPYIFEVIWRGSVFRVEFNHTNDEPIEVMMYLNVTKPDGTVLLKGMPLHRPSLPPNFLSSWQYWGFSEFREKGYLFGFFFVNVDFLVLNDGSSRKVIFPGFIFGISAIILDRDGRIMP